MFAPQINPPIGNYDNIQELMKEACNEFLNSSFKKSRFDRLYDLMFEEIEENMHEYIPQYEDYE